MIPMKHGIALLAFAFSQQFMLAQKEAVTLEQLQTLAKDD